MHFVTTRLIISIVIFNQTVLANGFPKLLFIRGPDPGSTQIETDRSLIK